MNFIYRAKDKEGILREGEIESADQHIAASTLRKKGLVVIEVKIKSEGGLSFLSKFFNKVSFGDLVTTTRQLATMVGAGLNLSDSVDILEEQQINKKFKEALGEISRDIKGGLALHQALGKHDDIFPPLYINLVKSGEASGKLDTVLLKMADSLEKDRGFKARIKGAMIYPILVISMMVVVIFIMMIFVVPKLTDFFNQASLNLPLPTKILIVVSSFMASYWWLIILTFITAVIFIRRWVKTTNGHLAMNNFILHIPLVGRITVNVTLTNFCRTFSLLIGAGIPLLDAIKIVQDVTTNAIFKKSLVVAYSGVERGLTLSSELIAMPIYPRLVGQMVRVGEETGKMDEIFSRLAEYYESESDNLVKNLTSAIEPLVLIVLGVGVAFLVLSIILPIYQLTTSF